MIVEIISFNGKNLKKEVLETVGSRIPVVISTADLRRAQIIRYRYSYGNKLNLDFKHTQNGGSKRAFDLSVSKYDYEKNIVTLLDLKEQETTI